MRIRITGAERMDKSMKLGVLTVPLQGMPAEEAFAYLYSPYKGLMLQKAYATRHRRLHQ